MNFQPGERVFVDESKSNGYYVVASAVAIGDHSAACKQLRSLLRSGQSRLHFQTEKDHSRKRLLTAMTQLDVRASVWVVKREPDKTARPRCIEAVTEAMLRDGATELFLERDASLERADRQIIAAIMRRPHGERPELRYRHIGPSEDPMLWVSDAVAWCYQKRGDWIRRAEPLVNGRVIHL